MQLELRGQYSGIPRLRRIAHRSYKGGVSMLPGGRFLLVKPKGERGTILYYDLDDEAPVARPLITFDAPTLPGLLFVSLCSSTKYEIALIIISAGSWLVSHCTLDHSYTNIRAPPVTILRWRNQFLASIAF